MRCSTSPAFIFTLTLLLLLNLTLASESRPTGSSNDLPAYTNDHQQQIFQNPNPASQRRDEAEEPPAHTPVATAAPNQDDILASKGYWQTTFYKCKTDNGGEVERCGWHTPILKAQARRELSMGVVIPAVMGAAGVFAWGLL